MRYRCSIGTVQSQRREAYQAFAGVYITATDAEQVIAVALIDLQTAQGLPRIAPR